MSHDAWETLEKVYNGSIKVKVVECFITRVQNIVNAIHAHGETLEDRRIVEKVLRSLPKKSYHYCYRRINGFNTTNPC